MWLDDALMILLDRVIELTLQMIERDQALKEPLLAKVRTQARIPLGLASTKFYEGLTEGEIETWAVSGAMHLAHHRRVGYQSTEVQLARAFRNYTMSAYLEYSKGLEDLP